MVASRALVASPHHEMPSRPVVLILTLFIVSIPVICWSLDLGVALTPSSLLGMAMVVTGSSVWLRRRDVLSVDLTLGAGLAFVLVAAATVVGVLLQPDVRVVGESSHLKSVKQLVGLGFGGAVFLSTVVVLRAYRLASYAVRVHYWTTVAFAVLTFIQYGLASVDITSPLANFPVHNSTLGGTRPLSLMYGFPRVSVTLVEPSILATYLLSGWAFWLYALDHPPYFSRRSCMLFRWSGALVGAAIIITGSRLAYGVFVVLTIAALVVRPARVQRLGLLAATLLLGVLLTGPQHGRSLLATLMPKAAPATASAATVATSGKGGSGGVAPFGAPAAEVSAMVATANKVESAAGTLDVSVQQRAASYLVALDVVRERPFLGVGFGLSSFAMERHWPAGFLPLPVERVAAATMMSHYATVLTETGLLGLLCMTVFTLGVSWRLIAVGRTGTSNHTLAWGSAGALASYYLSSVATALVVYQILLVWLLLAVAMSVGYADDPRTGVREPSAR